MANGKILSIFVDESGKFQYPDQESRFYILGMVFHSQDVSIASQIDFLDHEFDNMGLDSSTFVFHAGPLIRQEKGYALMNRHFRGLIFNKMMNFARNVDFNYHCLDVDKKYITSSLQIAARLQKSLSEFIAQHRQELNALEKVKIYYDCGQAPVTSLLYHVFQAESNCQVEFAQGVKPQKYKLFQLADLICTLRLIELKLANDINMTPSEFRFFGGPRAFLHDILRKLKPKEL